MGMGQGLEGFNFGRRGDRWKYQAVKIIGQRCGKQGDANAGDMLREAQGHNEKTMEQAEQGANQACYDNTEPQVATQEHREPAGKGARRHDAFNAEIQDSGTLADEFAEGSKNER